jgi:hypothetical protein
MSLSALHPRGEHNNWHIALAANRAANISPFIGEHEIEHNQSGLSLEGGQRLRAIFAVTTS